jgi:hypothetical protein
MILYITSGILLCYICCPLVSSANDFEFFGFYQHDTKFTPDNETDHLGEMENLNNNVRKMLEALEQQTKDQMNKLALEAIVLGQNVLNSAYTRFAKYDTPERFAHYMTPEEYKKFLDLYSDTRYCLEKIDSVFQTLPAALM